MRRCALRLASLSSARGRAFASPSAPLGGLASAAPQPLRVAVDGATTCARLAGEPPAFSVFASRRTLAALRGASPAAPPLFADLPAADAQLLQGRACAMLETGAGRVVLCAPLSGEVLRRNEALLAPDAALPGAPLWLLDVACGDEEEWHALQPADDAADADYGSAAPPNP